MMELMEVSKVEFVRLLCHGCCYPFPERGLKVTDDGDYLCRDCYPQAVSETKGG